MSGGRKAHLTEKEARALGIIPDPRTPTQTVDPMGPREPYSGDWYGKKMDEIEAINRIVKEAIPIPDLHPEYITLTSPSHPHLPHSDLGAGWILCIALAWLIGLIMGMAWR